MMRSAPRWMAGLVGDSWRIEPSPKYSTPPVLRLAQVERHRREHERNGRRRQQVRHADAGAHRDALQLARERVVVERLVEGDVAPRAVARGRPRPARAGGRAPARSSTCGKSIRRVSRSRSGSLSSSERGRARSERRTIQPSDSSDSQRAPLRMTPNRSERYTWSAWKFSQTSTSCATASWKLSERLASAVALMAPAEVPDQDRKRVLPLARCPGRRRGARRAAGPPRP